MLNIISFIQHFGYLGLFVVVFFESFPLTFFFPGDSLLFTTGFLASQGFFSLPALVLTFFIAGTFGYVFSYFFGQKIIRRFFTDDKSKIFNPKYIVYTHKFFEKYGGKTIIIGRFVPIVRSFGPALAGVADLTFKRFLTYTIIGGIFWSAGMTLVGFYLGRILPRADEYLTPIILVIIAISLLPTVIEYLKHKRRHQD
jgi:membrane-associated protein